jgi:hypothetical protein
MPALAAAAGAFLVAAVDLWMLRASGGWMELYRLRRGHPTRQSSKAWEDLFPIERGWFYGVPIFGSLGVVFMVIGLAVVAG